MRAVAAFLLPRLAKMAAVIFAIVIANFLLIHAAPGDPATVLAGQSGASDARFIAQLRKQFGLDQPLTTQLWRYVSRVAQGDLGISHLQQRPVAALIAERLSATVLLTGLAFVFSIVAGVGLGLAAARRAGTWVDSTFTVLALVFYATPIFWVGLILVLVFSVWLDWLPSFGMATVGIPLTGAASWLDVARHAVLPAITLGLFYMAVYARMARATLLEALGQDYVRTARAKGATEGRILGRHVLRNALLPIVTLAGVQAGQLIGGSVLVETVFAWPGIGRLAFDALLARDYQILLGVFLTTSVMVVLFNLLTDLLYVLIDPRVRTA